MRAILGHQQPPGEPCLHDVEARAAGGLRQLGELNEGVAVEASLQRSPALQFASEAHRVHAQSGAAALNYGTHGRDVDAESERNAEHAFASDQADFERGRSVDRHEPRHHPADRSHPDTRRRAPHLAAFH